MRTSDADILIVPGWSNSGPDHWQTRWERKLSTARRVVQRDWERPLREPWVRAVSDAVRLARRPVVLVAHSVGVHAVLHAAPTFMPGAVAGAFLVAPPSAAAILDMQGYIDEAFIEPAPRLAFPALMVASRSDSYSSYEESAVLAERAGAQLVDAGDSGHINSASGHGPWPEGLLRFAKFLNALDAPIGRA